MHKNENTNSITSDDNTDNTISTVIKLTQWLQHNYNYNTSLLPYHIQYNKIYKGYGMYSKQEFSVTCGNDLNQLKALLNNNNNTLQPLISIPYKLCVTTKLVQDTIINNIVKFNSTSSLIKTIQSNDYQLLSLFLIYHRRLGINSKYNTYIDTLPKTYTRLEWWNKVELNIYQNVIDNSSFVETELQDTIKQQINQCNQLNHLIGFNKTVTTLSLNTCDNIDNIISITNCTIDNVWYKPITIHEYQWAYSTVATRSLYMPDNNNNNSATGHSILAPYIDMFNHSSYTSTLPYYNQYTQQYQLYLHSYKLSNNLSQQEYYDTKTSKLYYNENNELYISYGLHHNSLLIERYGFASTDNIHDYISIKKSTVDNYLTNNNYITNKYTNNDTTDNLLNDILTQCGLHAMLTDNTYQFHLYCVTNDNTISAWDLQVYLTLLAVLYDILINHTSYDTNQLLDCILNDTSINDNVDNIVKHMYNVIITSILSKANQQKSVLLTSNSHINRDIQQTLLSWIECQINIAKSIVKQ